MFLIIVNVIFWFSRLFVDFQENRFVGLLHPLPPPPIALATNYICDSQTGVLQAIPLGSAKLFATNNVSFWLRT